MSWKVNDEDTIFEKPMPVTEEEITYHDLQFTPVNLKRAKTICGEVRNNNIIFSTCKNFCLVIYHRSTNYVCMISLRLEMSSLQTIQEVILVQTIFLLVIKLPSVFDNFYFEEMTNMSKTCKRLCPKWIQTIVFQPACVHLQKKIGHSL